MINLGKITEHGKDVILEELENGCLRCVSHCVDGDGYTRVRYKEKHERLFRVIYMQKHGDIPKGMVIRHKCDNPYCCNIDHLEIGTPWDNVHDMIDRGRFYNNHSENVSCRGTRNIHHKLTEEQVKEIYLSKLSNRELSRLYKVSDTNIGFIKNKKEWKWLTDTLD